MSSKLVFVVLCVAVNFLGTYHFSMQRNNIYAFCREIPQFMLFGTKLGRCSIFPKTEDLKLLNMLYNGSRLATSECQHQFRYKPWNCSTTVSSMRKLVFHVFPETAYLYAIHSAGAAYSMAYACSRGITKDCICPGPKETVLITKSKDGNETDTKRHTIDRHCSKDSLNYGVERSRSILKNVKHGDPRSKIDEHNKEAGRLSLLRTGTTEVCHCRGVSGSCTVVKCFVMLPKFRDIASNLVKRYNHAVRAAVDNYGEKIIPAEPTIMPPTKEDLVYLEKSPDYCLKDLEKGSLGTESRPCKLDVPKTDARHCSVLCCDNGWKSVKVLKKEMCNCKFDADTITISCDKCEKSETVHVCKGPTINQGMIST